MIHLDTARVARGMSALATRSASPPETTDGAASQTRRKTGGRLRSAASRSRQIPLCDFALNDNPKSLLKLPASGVGQL